MFQIANEIAETLEWPVIVEVPVNGGKTRKYEFLGIFRRLGADEKKEFVDGIQADRNADDENWEDKFLDKICTVLVGWKSVVDQNNVPIEFGRESLRAAIRSPNGGPIMAGLNRAIYQFESGTKAKN